ncbi:MAG TPA: ABC transporter permease [Candidatus Solibacter sp.]|nr:ABC transporter permease [Candidatus Solibacter sp.]
MREQLREFYKYRGLLYMLTYRDIKVRYKQSIMGFLWAILMPVLIVLSGIVVRYAYALAAHTPLQTADITGVAVKSLPWAFLVSSIRFSCLSLINNKELVTKIYFPKEIFPLAATLASLFDFVIAAGALLVFLVIMQVGWSVYLLWIPVLVLTTVVLSAGVGMIVSAASLYFRDVKFIVEVFLTFGIFFTPVFYDVSMLGSKGKWLLLNPASALLDGLGACVARHQSPDVPWFAYSVAFSLFALLGGYIFFKHLEDGFAESI